MAYIPGFDYDIFISYARLDNMPYNAGESGWISEFNLTLHTVLLQKLTLRTNNLNPYDLNIFLDKRDIKGNEDWDTVIETALKGSAIMISILSGQYLASNYCLKELNLFSEQNNALINIGGKNSNRVFKVVIDNIPSNGHPKPILKNNGYEFYSVNPLNKQATILRKMKGGFINEDYRSLIEKLAQEIADLIKEILKKPEEHSNIENPVVYLAEVPDDLAQERDAIRNELIQRKVIVYPTAELSEGAGSIQKVIENDMEKSEFYIHLLGPSYKPVSKDDNRSLTKILHDVATVVAARKGQDDNQKKMKRIVWIKHDFDIEKVEEQEHREFLQSLVSDENPNAPLVVIREPSIEKLKDLILKRIFPDKIKPPPPLEKSSVIFISNLPDDETEAMKISEYLGERNHTVVWSLNDPDKRERDKDSLAQLSGCEAVIVLYGNESGRPEVRRRLNQVMKMAERRRKNPFIAKSLCDGPPDPKKHLGVVLNKNEWIEIMCREGIKTPEQFNSFYEALANSQKR